jgi:ribulose-5-phosphate 4-epimerase/fuculose-1-phosphate aldolase
VRDQVAKFSGKILANRSALPGHVAVAAQDDSIISDGNPALARLCVEALPTIGCAGLVAARPSLPFAEFLVRRAKAGEARIVPLDTETRTFLHDIPFLRSGDPGSDDPGRMAALLGMRKGIIVEGVGIIAAGALTVEQAYVNYSSVFHATFVKYLLDLLSDGFLLPGEREAFGSFRGGWLLPLSAAGLAFRSGPLENPAEIMEEAAAVGRYVVEHGLADSFFGNLSCRAGGTIYISRTAASLDELAGNMDAVPADSSSTAGITASSELKAHRRIYEESGARTILHGHPKFSVAVSMLCDETGCPVKDCWKDCDRVRMLGDTPVVAGEIGAGGLATRVPPVIASAGKTVVYGHGVFTLGRTDFAEAFRSMIAVENRCRREYFRRFDALLAS